MTVIIDPSADDDDSQFLMYPERKRCRRCRCFFGFIVINRLYCSYECARKTPPDPDIRKWPRYCRTRKFEPKVTYMWPGQVDIRQHNHETIHLYHCDYCGMYHLGHRYTKANDDASTTTAPRQRIRGGGVDRSVVSEVQEPDSTL